MTPPRPSQMFASAAKNVTMELIKGLLKKPDEEVDWT